MICFLFLQFSLFRHLHCYPEKKSKLVILDFLYPLFSRENLMEDNNFSKLLKQKYLNFNINVIFGDKIQMIFFLDIICKT